MLVSLLLISVVVTVVTHLNFAGASSHPSITIGVLWLALTVALFLSGVYSRSHRNTAQTVLRIWKVTVASRRGHPDRRGVGGPMDARPGPAVERCAGVDNLRSDHVRLRVAVALRQRDQGTAGARVMIVVGSGTVAKDVVSRLERIAGVEVMGLVDDGPCDPGVIGSTRQLPDLCRALKVQRV